LERLLDSPTRRGRRRPTARRTTQPLRPSPLCLARSCSVRSEQVILPRSPPEWGLFPLVPEPLQLRAGVPLGVSDCLPDPALDGHFHFDAQPARIFFFLHGTRFGRSRSSCPDIRPSGRTRKGPFPLSPYHQRYRIGRPSSRAAAGWAWLLRRRVALSPASFARSLFISRTSSRSARWRLPSAPHW